MKRGHSKIIYNVLTAALILLECIAAFICCAIISLTSQYNRIDKLRSEADILITSNIRSSDFSAAVNTSKKEYDEYIEELNRWKGPVLSKSKGTVMGPSGKETYYNLNMTGVVNIMRRLGNTDEYWVREDGCKMLGDYIMVAANLDIHPRGSIVETSLGQAIVCDTGGFAKRNPNQIDVAVTW